MRILVAEDDALFRRLVQQVLAPEHEIVLAEDGGQAWAMLQAPEHPPLAILDWVMPVMSGPQICRMVREHPQLSQIYLMLLTAKNSAPDVVSGLRAGADDYVTKPFIPEELRARVRIGERLLQLEFSHHCQAAELHQAREREARLQKLLPMCPRCGKIRSEPEYWQSVDTYVREHRNRAAELSACELCFHPHAAVS
jgi:phosphoserine phosphatase RsbU/P